MDISIIIPTHKRYDLLMQCLDSIFRQDYPKDKYEVIVVMDGGYNIVEEMLKKLTDEYKNLRYVVQKARGPAAARNLGASLAKGEILGFSDDDCILDKNWIKNSVDSHKINNDIVAIGGLTEVNNNKVNAWVSQFLANGAIKCRIDGKEEVIFFPTCNISYKRHLLEKERFNELFPLPAGEDLEYFWRLFKKGYRYLYREDIKVLHNRQGSLYSFLKQAYMYGRGNYLVQHIHRDHPLLKEIRSQNSLSFVFGTIINFIKIPRFSYLLGRRLIKASKRLNFYKKFKIYLFFALHKIVYLIGNITEHIRAIKFDTDVLYKISEETKKSPDRLGFIILDITHRCNLRCNICEIRKDKLIKEFTAEEVKGLIKQSIEWGVEEFVLSGGEPFVREDIFGILDFVKENNYCVGILTNGILLNKEFTERLLPYLISNTLSLCISLDALTPEIHDSIRGDKGCFEKTLGGLKFLSDFKIKYPNINFNVISIILNENLEELLTLANFLKSLNVNSIQFQALLANNLLMKQRSNRVKYWIPRERLPVLDGVIDNLIEFKKQNPYFVRNSENNLHLVKKYFRGLLNQKDIKCLYATKTILIANNGDVTTCFGAYGNVRKADLKKIWNSEEIMCAREKVRNCKSPCLLPCFTDNQ